MLLNWSFLDFSMEHTVYDYAIVGAGAAGLQLALKMANDVYFLDKKIAIVEKDKKDKNDRTWCYWEKGTGKWDDLLTARWSKAQFANNKKVYDLGMGSYEYKMLRAVDFYQHAKKTLQLTPHVTWINASVENVSQGDPCKIDTDNEQVKANHVFDSRIESGFKNKNDKYTRLWQHFKGWIIETERPAFDPNKFMMMDFRIKWPDTTSFTYVLPLANNKALVEFTFFSPEIIQDEAYDPYLAKYIKEVLHVENYNIKEVERGIIPMSDYPFERSNTATLTKIGTAGGWVKPSSGYSFKNADRYAHKVISNIKQGKMPSENLFKNRFKKYDSLFLDVLWNNNELGDRIFSDMYSKNSTELILKFLDEKTTFSQELKIISSFQKWPFTKALLRSFV